MKLLKVLFTLSLFFFLTQAHAQFRMVGSGSWTPVNDSVHTGTITFQADLTGNGYLPTGITDTMYIFTGTEQKFRISNVSGATFSSATLTVVEVPATTSTGPVGQVMVFADEGRETIPQIPFGATGSTAQLQAAVDTWNARIDATGGSGSTTLQEAIDAELTADGGSTMQVTWPSGIILRDDGSDILLQIASSSFEMDGDSADLTITGGEVVYFSNASDQDKIGITIRGFGENAQGVGGTYDDLQDNSLVPKAYVDDAVSSGGYYTDQLTSGSVTAVATRVGGSTAVTISNPGAGDYGFTIPTGGRLIGLEIYGNNSTLNPANEFLIRVDNSNNSLDQRYMIEVYDANNGALVDVWATGTVPVQTIPSTNITLFTIPGMNGFGATGFYVIIK